LNHRHQLPSNDVEPHHSREKRDHHDKRVEGRQGVVVRRSVAGNPSSGTHSEYDRRQWRA
jgi:hypothetical protein